MSVLSDSVFACPGTGCSPRPPSRRYCRTTAATPGTSGTWPSKDPRERMGELGDSGFIVFTVDDDAELVRVYGLVWIG